MARMLIAALRAGGHDVAMASGFRSFLPSPDPEAMRELEAAALHEVEGLIAEWQDAPSGPPDVWFTYHSYYKAPDLIGAKVAARFGMTYVTAEASHAGKRAAGPWARWHDANEASIRAAALHVCFTARDAEGLAGLVAPEAIAMLPPFLDAGPFGAAQRRTRGSGRVDLVTVAMMRPGDKTRSYACLAEALSRLPTGVPWHLTIVGDGPERAAVERLFGGIPAERLTWTGEMRPDEMATTLGLGRPLRLAWFRRSLRHRLFGSPGDRPPGPGHELRGHRERGGRRDDRPPGARGRRAGLRGSPGATDRRLRIYGCVSARPAGAWSSSSGRSSVPPRS